MLALHCWACCGIASASIRTSSGGTNCTPPMRNANSLSICSTRWILVESSSRKWSLSLRYLPVFSNLLFVRDFQRNSLLSGTEEGKARNSSHDWDRRLSILLARTALNPPPPYNNSPEENSPPPVMFHHKGNTLMLYFFNILSLVRIFLINNFYLTRREFKGRKRGGGRVVARGLCLEPFSTPHRFTMRGNYIIISNCNCSR